MLSSFVKGAGRVVCLAVLTLASWPALGADEPLFEVGIARADITPDTPVRLSGYAVRRAEAEGIAQRLWAKAIAVSKDNFEPAVLITVDNTGVPAAIVEKIARKLAESHGVARERIVICSSHTHAAPCLSGALPLLFAMPVPAEHQVNIDRYTERLIEAIEKVAVQALGDRHPARLSWAQGKAGFAANRRTGVTPLGPVDHALPVLEVSDPKGTTRAVVVNYACHCTTLGGEFNQVCGDWAGYAQQEVEEAFPRATCLVTIGCGGDANPSPRGELEHARQHGRTIAEEVRRLLESHMRPLREGPACTFERIALPFETPKERAVWEERAKSEGIVGFHAAAQLARLDRGEPLRTELPYAVQAWKFGEDLSIVFLAGEVVVDYALRLKRELGPDRLWVTAYANDVPCYIPSRRILSEGGYEAEGAMLYYDQPDRLKPEVEDQIVQAVRRVLRAPAAAATQPAQRP